MKVTVLLSISLVLPLVGCRGEGSTTKASPTTRRKAVTESSAGAVSRIVFVDKEKACACTRERIDKSWKALTDVVGFPPVPEVERIHMDSQPKKAAPYKEQRPIMVPPAVYFFDKSNKLKTFLQGEVTREQVQRVLK